MIDSRKLLTALCALALVQALHAQTLVPVPPVPQNVVQLTATGSVEVAQDLLTISLGTTREGSDAASVQGQLKVALDAALAEARKTAQTGLLEVHTGSFSLYPRYTKEGKISTWQGTAELVLEGRDFARISSTAGRIPGLTIGNLGFSLSREQRAKVETEAQAMAIESFKIKAFDIARSFGFSSYSLREVSINANDNGAVPRMRAAMQVRAASSDMAVPVEAGKTAVVVTVSGAVQLK